MKTIFMIFALALSSAGTFAATAETGTFGDAVSTVNGINYDNEWNGKNSAGKKCSVSHEEYVDGDDEFLAAIEISTNTSRNRWVSTRVELDRRTPFRVTQNNGRNAYVQIGKRSDRNRAVVEVNYIAPQNPEEDDRHTAQVVLKTNLDAVRVDCIVQAYE